MQRFCCCCWLFICLLLKLWSGTHNIKFTILTTIMEKAMAPHSSTLAWKIPWTEEPGRRSPWGHEESDTTEQLHFHFSLSCIGEGNGNPLQCSCLENPRDGGAWWAAVCGVAQSRTWLKWFSSSSTFVGQITVSILSLIHVSWGNVCFSLTPWEGVQTHPWSQKSE